MSARVARRLTTFDEVLRIRTATILPRPIDAGSDLRPCTAVYLRIRSAAASPILVYPVVDPRLVSTAGVPLRHSIHVLRGFKTAQDICNVQVQFHPCADQEWMRAIMIQISATLVVPGQVVACEGEDVAGFETSRLPLLGGVEDPTHGGLLHQLVQYHPQKKSIHRNDPNLSPREGDWICRKPICGNLNFARRTYCNNCHKFRFDEPYGSTHSPRRATPALPHPVISLKGYRPSPGNRGTRRDFDGYRSPPRVGTWTIPGTLARALIPPRRGGKLIDPVRRENLEFRKDSFRGRGRSNWTVDDWEPRGRGRDSFISDSRGANRRSPSPQDRWIRDARGRSRSPVVGRLPRSSFVGRGRESRRYDGPYDGRAGILMPLAVGVLGGASPR
ncbi:hypothetical protein KSP40_PGU009331 [Platanthera guangdongensis]|uniref:RanBP2-type domain-containing protein n=1 Tax=Platanthera guangdongensis TaxID=2320717 RepID=A0ABR2LEI3_9ASPA